MEALSPTILAVDDEPSVLESYRLILEDEYHLLTAQDGEEALKILNQHNVELVLLDLKLPGISGLEVLERIKQLDEQLDVIVITALNEVEFAVKAIKLGAYDYFTKPFDIDKLLTTIRRVFERQALLKEVLYLRLAMEQQQFINMVGRNAKMLQIFDLITRVAQKNVTVLITGESGTGKELVARAIHQHSDRAHKPFIAVNCAAIPEHLMESELFGHERGAFTSAIERRLGKFELAHGGTLFLDEVSSMRMELQAKILRALQEREIERVGGQRTIPVDVRIIAATNQNLRALVKQGKFREDLYYRLNVVPIFLPPLRARKDDIPLLVEHFLEKYNRRFQRSVKGFTPSAMERLLQYDWPGNIRELENIIERLVAITTNEYIQLRELPIDLSTTEPDLTATLLEEKLSLREALQLFEKHFILHTLEKVRWNQTLAAKMLGIHRNTLASKLDALGLRQEGRSSSDS
ncbi:MAG: sigma-54-dependent Fis family transcriptional regulator [Nitrospinota bacterium]|nr:MAG: sigma-54-dependent Fis family transcriptional regulator [Nitrospinota bacterium]